MPTPEEELEYMRLRMDIGFAPDDLEGFSDAKAAEVFAEANSLYTGAASRRNATRVIALGRLAVDALKMTSFTQNNTREELAEIAKGLRAEEAKWQRKLDASLAAELAVAKPGNRPPSFNGRVISEW